MKTPVFDALKRLMEEDSVFFHMPGHKGKNTLINWGDYIPFIDTTETEGMDNLLDPRGIIQESQELAAKVFGAKYTQYAVNGSTGSIYIALATITKPGDKILVQRNCHKAVYNAMILNRLNPIYMYPNYNEEYHVMTGLDPKDIDDILTEDDEIKAVVITYPNYYGVCSDLETIAKIVHKHNRILMVDEAHGPHMTFSERLPKPALECGADIVIHSTHKTMASFTQTSMIHVGTDRVDLNKLRDRFQLYTTTSPSYLFTASNEIATAYMDSMEARKKLEWNIDKCEETIKRLNAIDRVFVFTGDENDKTIFAKDNTKILFRIDGMKGSQVKKQLYAKYNIRLEMTDYYYALALTSFMNEEEDYERLIAAVEDLAKTAPYDDITPVSIKLPTPEVIMPIYEAYHGNKKQRELKYSIGKISATAIIPYPPGVPLVVPGEEITQELYEQITFLMENGIEIVGLMGYNKDRLVVVE
ncbi:aminotransferase class I/II-fold pyridoxal phosphate-dependent enzyme [Tissierella carlieri]|jgi:arginine/lysine/ornithine decarboxylase|uniref:aminotransferase class I/II-fold pyridoxal phosphate-dependent enzyme n=1 Tax=Tissierella TaxID=41273 RepID=UPI000B9FEAAD|nr:MULTISPECIES: aminotransferase class I/II-fold pyridoxal phosphate-dependent enzyme [Tissierella]MBU5313207.1 aminotransferase class I/II-fold pyridoxal phosphate-dependent enzyme [Tissierella carlieri]MDU5081324.1 aminotransferase class I/II-fold pyridoxal phosphate-dependent enzyme [Bacillota bacterium]OZV12668.1 arginine / lysine / ornithine decarboxylase [Tissierella sp. P1]